MRQRIVLFVKDANYFPCWEPLKKGYVNGASLKDTLSHFRTLFVGEDNFVKVGFTSDDPAPRLSPSIRLATGLVYWRQLFLAPKMVSRKD